MVPRITRAILGPKKLRAPQKAHYVFITNKKE